MPWILPNATCVVREVSVLLVACGYCWTDTNGLLNVYFFCNIFRALSISDGIEG